MPVETPMFHHPLVITYAKVETLFAGEMKTMTMMRTRTLQHQPTMTMMRTQLTMTRTKTRTQLTMTMMRTRTQHQLISITPKSRGSIRRKEGNKAV